MLLFENVLLALNGLKANKARAVLTMLGIIIGIASVIAIMTIGTSMTSAMEEEYAEFGVDVVEIYVCEREEDNEAPGFMQFERSGREMKDSDLMTEEMIDYAREGYGDKIKGISLEKNVGEGRAKNGSLYAKVKVLGVNPDAVEKRDPKLLAGRFFTKEDYETGKKVALVTDYFCDNMFAGDNEAALRQQIRVVLNGNYYFYTIVGVYEYEESAMDFVTTTKAETSTNLFIPLETAKKQLHGDKGYESAEFVGKTVDDASVLDEELADYLSEKFYGKNKFFTLDSYTNASWIEETKQMMNTMSLAVSLIAGISLLVGGIGVMNIMLVSITERTREIGTRKALGATNGSIRIQFITESIVLCLLGGLIGLTLGVVMGLAGSKAMGYDGHVDLMSVLVSVGFSAFIGIFFGYYPANKAAKMNPIEALRYE